MHENHLISAVLGAVCLMAACAPAPSSGGRTAETANPAPAGGPRGALKLAWPLEPDALHPKFLTGSGNGDYNWIFSSAITYLDFRGTAHPMLAETIPTQENGGWVINPDGTMVTTYRLRPNLKWHDGVPLTTEDFLFGFEVTLDQDIAVQDRQVERRISRIDTPDDRTLVVHWKEPYVAANTLGYRTLSPIPRHRLEQRYRTNKGSFLASDDWTVNFIGNGPFYVEQWNPGSNLLARAFTDWALGPPKLERIDIRFVKDANTMLANLLAGEVDMINSPGIRPAEAVLARDQWVAAGQGSLKTYQRALWYIGFQFREVPDWQPAVTDLRVRRAMMHAVDREGLADAITLGLGSVAHAFITATDATFPEVDAVLTKYPYDPNRAAALLADAGWRRTSEGATLTNAAGQSFDVSAFGSSDQAKTATIVADNWKSAGMNATPFVIPQGRERDQQFRANFPSTEINSRTIANDNFVFNSASVATAENGYLGSNRGGFADPDIDRFHELRLTTLDEGERRRANIEVNRRLSELVGIGPLLYSVEAILTRNGVTGPIGIYAGQQGLTWNVHEWEIAG
ncbi:MAG: hypothetical protein HW416_3711 [Chloroflexi bacterium]|nr:hypothetical protein [Chloroflexota bacterium]